MTYGGVYYEGCTNDDTYGWCATATSSYGGSYTTWGYCGLGDATNGDTCIFPFSHNGITYYDCYGSGSTSYCAKAVYQGDLIMVSYKSCDDSDFTGCDNADCLAEFISASDSGSAGSDESGSSDNSEYTGYGTGVTIYGEECVPMTYGGVYYEGCTNDDTYGWCATATSSYGGSYTTWGYCGLGDATNGDTCIFPFSHNGITYYDCYGSGSTSYCAKAVYQGDLIMVSYKSCDDSDFTGCDNAECYAEFVSGSDSASAESLTSTGYSGYGSGRTTTGEDCVPMTYGGVYYEGCTSDDAYAWCATAVSSSGSYTAWQYCGYGDSNGDACVWEDGTTPHSYSGQQYHECVDKESNSPWCATSVYQSSYDYASWRYCNFDDLSTGDNHYNNGTGTTINAEECVQMVYKVILIFNL